MNDYKLFGLFKSTLEMLSYNQAYIKHINKLESLREEDVIQYYLDELEGDTYTFLHFGNLKQLLDYGFISSEIFQLASELREVVQVLPIRSWTVKYYKEDLQWRNIHSLAQAILNIL
jgi:hypothetical protein